MPIDIESDQWGKSKQIDILEVEIERYLQKNSETAYTASEIADDLTVEKPEAFPESVLAERDAARLSRTVLVTSRLEKLAWHDRVEARTLDNESYYTDREDGQFPIAEVDQNIPNRFIDLEQKIEEIDDQLGRIRILLRDLDEVPSDFDLQ
ncbi:hypothetical protein [Natronococcus sp. A-GB7]|uniref:hypothetical protein n=1 Tax=Natronococcus sp. A-GB7 TaxID=3037649 RepID=UPI00241CD837|nr:hypothetical protein [Natronococcus sp. A-GB7]MDG5819705.1 hypothetical protein [Natronococcus sp. A-GB7]